MKIAATLDDILQIDDIEKELVEVPEWNMSVYVRVMTGLARDDFEEACLKAKDDNRATPKNFRAELLARTMCDESGKLLCSADKVNELAEKSSKALSRLAEMASKLNGLSAEDQDELMGNSEAAPGGSSSSNSAGN